MLPLLLPAALAATSADLQSILIIELYRLPAEAMVRFVGDEDPQIRARAALALGRLKDPDALDELARLSLDSDPEVREAAAFALGLTPGGASAAREALAGETEERVRARLIAALGLHHEEADIPLLTRSLAGEPGEAREAAVALGRMGIAEVAAASTPEVFDALSGELASWDPQVREAAAFALARLPPPGEALDDATAEELLKRLKSDPDPDVRGFLMRALSRSAPGYQSAALQEAASDRDVGVRVAAARASGAIGGSVGATTLQTLLQDPDWSVRLAAIQASSGVEGIDPATLQPFLESGAADLAAAALTALGERGLLDNARLWLQPNQPISVQMAAVGTLTDPVQLFRLAAESPDAPLRSAAADRVMALGPDSAQLIGLLSASDAAIAGAAAAKLAEMPDKSAISPLLARMKTESSHDYQAGALSALAAIYKLPDAPKPTEEVKDLVRAGLRSPDPAVRAAAEAAAEVVGVELKIPPLHFLTGLPMLEDILSIQGARILTDAGEIRITLYPEVAPITVWNFAQLAERGAFDGLAFHRVVPDFVIQDGCPRGDGWGGPGYSIPDELSWLPYDEGAVGMALSGPDTGGSQWFMTLSPQPHLEAGYTVFGHLSLENSAPRRVRQGTVIQDVIIERVE